MATITSTIRLVDQMTPTLNKISKAIDRVNTQTNKLGSARTWNGFNTGVRTATKSTHNLYNALRRVAFTLGALRGLQGLVTISDTMMNATARLGNLTENAAETAYYMDAIYAAAQRSRGEFMSMANSVGKLGTVAGHAFGSVEEMIAFTELMNKLFVISGSSAAEASNAMYQLTQAMAAGRLQGDEMRSILENAPMLAQRIADYMGVSIGEVKQLGAEGVITADIIKAALFGAADDIEERYSKMPKTIGQIWTQIKNHALNAFRPVIDRVQQFINSPMFQKFQNKIYDIISAIANKIILFFDLLETPRVQKAIQAICNAFAVLWDVISWVGQLAVDVAVWICDNWSWIGDIVFAVVAALLLYKAVTLTVSAAAIAANIAQGISAWAAGLMAGQAWAWVILIIVALIAVIYLGVAAWNHFTGASVSATGVLLGCIAFVISGIISLFVFLWDVLVSIWHTLIYVGKLIVMVFAAVIDSAVQIIYNCYQTLVWVLGVLLTVFGNVISGLGQCLAVGKAYVDRFQASADIAWLNVAIAFVDCINSMISGASDGVKEMLRPILSFANKCIDVFNAIAEAWNNSLGSFSTTITNPFTGTTYDIGFDKIKLAEHVSVDDGGLSLGQQISNRLKSNRNQAILDKNAAQSRIDQGVNWGTFDIPSYSDFTNWSSVGEAWNHGWNLFGGLGEMSTGLIDKYRDTWDSSQYSNPVEAFKTWYKRGEAFENGVGDVVDGIGALLSGLFGGGLSDTLAGNGKLPFTPDGSVPESMEDLLGGYGGSGSPNDLLGTIADNTGRGAGSAANIDDTLDLAEDELELLRKIAEKEVVNRFTTAEIKVDMTNHNNVSSNMDLDGIVTHLSTKLYEELGVVASGVHY